MTTLADSCSRFESYLIAELDNTKLAKPKSADRRSRLESYLIAALDDLIKPGDIALDIETYDPTPVLGKGGARIPSALEKITDRFQSKVRLLQLYRQGGDQVWLLDMKAWEEGGMLVDTHLQPLRHILASAERRIVGHGITTFDAPWVWHHFRLRFARIVDSWADKKDRVFALGPASLHRLGR